MNCFDALKIEKTVDIKQIKRAYARCLKDFHPEKDPKGFQNLKENFNIAIQWARNNQDIEISVAVETNERNYAAQDTLNHGNDIYDEVYDDLKNNKNINGPIELEENSDGHIYDDVFQSLKNTGNQNLTQVEVIELESEVDIVSVLNKFNASLDSFNLFYSKSYWDSFPSSVNIFDYISNLMLEKRVIDYVMTLIKDDIKLQLPEHFYVFCDRFLNLSVRVQDIKFIDVLRQTYKGDHIHKFIELVSSRTIIYPSYYEAFINQIPDGYNPHLIASKLVLISQNEYREDWRSVSSNCDAALSEFPDVAYFYQKKLQVVENTGKLDASELIDEYKALIDLETNSEALFKLGDLYYSFGEMEKAIDYFEKSLVINGSHYGALVRAARVLDSRANYKKKFRYAKKAYELRDKKSFPIRVMLHRLYSDLKRQLKTLTENEFELYKVIFEIGIYIENFDELRELIISYGKERLSTWTIEQQSTIYRLYGEVYSGMNDLIKASEYYELAVGSKDENEIGSGRVEGIENYKACIGMMAVALHKNDFETFERVLTSLKNSKKDHAYYHLLARYEITVNSNYSDALNYINLAIDEEVRAQYLLTRAECYYFMNQYELCIKELNLCSTDVNKNKDYATLLADAHFKLKHYSEAYLYYKKSFDMILKGKSEDYTESEVGRLYQVYKNYIRCDLVQIQQLSGTLMYSKAEIKVKLDKILEYYERLDESIKSSYEKREILDIQCKYYSLRDGDESEEEDIRLSNNFDKLYVEYQELGVSYEN